MAIYFFNIESIGRSAGRKAPAAAAYRAGEAIRDERSGKLYDYRNRQDVADKALLAPSRFGSSLPLWASDRQQLWNVAERAERRKDARVAREFTAALPVELDAGQRRVLARSFGQELADRYGVMVDLAVHEPRPDGDPRNHHAHFLTTTRQALDTGLGAKTGLDATNRVRRELGQGTTKDEFYAIRARWAERVNEALAEAGLETSVPVPRQHVAANAELTRARLPWGAYLQEKAGGSSQIADRVRERYRRRLEQRRELAPEPMEKAAPPNLAQLRSDARREWLAYRAQEKHRPMTADARNERLAEDDHAL